MIIKIIFLILLLNIYFISPIISVIPNPISYVTNSTSIIIKYNAADIYYSKWIFVRLNDKKNMTFDCVLASGTRTCTYTPTTLDQKKQLYGFVGVQPCITTSLGETCSGDLEKVHYPTPQITNNFKPPTKGGNTLLQGTFLIMTGALFKMVDDTNVLVIDQTGSATLFDPTNITLAYPAGCGLQIFVYPNGNTYNFKYQPPNIYLIERVKSTITIIGSNFCNTVDKIDIKVDNISINNSNILIQPTTNDEIHFDYDQVYPSNITVKIISGGSESNDVYINFPPMVTSISSTPLKGGIVTIIGERMANNTMSSLVMIGSVACSIIKYNTTSILCNLPAGSGDNKSVLVIVNGIPNDFTNNIVQFSYGIPTISSYSVNGNTITLIGVNFGNSLDSTVQLETSNVAIKGTVSTDETSIIFTLPSNYVKQLIHIVSYSKTSNSLEIDVNFNTIQKTYPSTEGQLINYQLNNVLDKNSALIPDMIIMSDVNGNKTIHSINGTRDGTTSNYLFSYQIPSGCGAKNIEIIIGDQHHVSTLRYDYPIISNCNTSLDTLLIICNGLNFGVDIDSAIIHFSNLDVKPIQITHNQFSISNNELFKTGEISITVCNLSSTENAQVAIESFYLYPPKFNTIGGIIEIIRHTIDSNTDTSIDCGLDGLFKCELVNSTIYQCPVNLPGPNERTCTLNFQGEQNKSVIVIDYLLPIVNKIDSIQLSGGKLTIYGSEFYNSTKKITIGSLNCGDIIWINSTVLSCTLENNPNLSQSFDELLYVNITNPNDKSGGALIFKYFNPNSINPKDSSENSNEDQGETEEEKKKKKLTWLIPSIICPIVFVIAVIFIGPELYRRYYTFPPPPQPKPEPGFERRPYNPPNLNNRLYEDTPALYRYDSENPPQLSFVPIQP